MTAEVTREQFTALERKVEGEKLVAGHILGQTRRNGDDLAAVNPDSTGSSRSSMDFERLFDGLNRNLPKIVGKVMRDVLDERDGRR
jgi:hypothetical protein